MSGEWLAQLPDDLKANEALTSYATIGDFAKAHLDTVGKVSEFEGKVKEFEGKVTDLTTRLGNAVVIPGEGATEAEVAAFYSKLGRPESPEGYEIKKPAELPEGIQYNEDVDKAFVKFAHDNGLSAKQAQAIHGWYYGLVKNGFQLESEKKAQAEASELKARQDSIAKLQADWGAKFNENKEYAVRAFKEFAKENKDAIDLIENVKVGDVKLGDHPSFLKLFNAIGTKIFGDKATFDNDGGGGDDTPEAKERKAAADMFPSMKKET